MSISTDPVQLAIFAIAGALGALVRVLLSGAVQLPRVKRGRLYLGFITDMALGAVIGAAIDHHWLTAFAVALAGRTTAAEILDRVKNRINEKRGR